MTHAESGTSTLTKTLFYCTKEKVKIVNNHSIYHYATLSEEYVVFSDIYLVLSEEIFLPTIVLLLPTATNNPFCRHLAR